ncbi:NAD-dependent succinate-semialdehyde dehydrogenase [Vibrio sp.]|uniref:NAD-dependent succinate-semialdehyde dehydrogenase n=1 Tax=Vibrio sp. TaxID=678 RepID=UPI003D0ADE4A
MIELNDPSLFHQRCYLNGNWTDAENLATCKVYNPADGALIGTVPNLTCGQIEMAIEYAHDAFKLWKTSTAQHRAEILLRWYQLMMEHRDDLAKILTLEQGKPLAEAKGEISYAASFIQWFAEEAKRAYGELIPSHKADARILVNKEPVGVVAAITPWNFPAAMITRKCAPALAAGCSVVLKPSHDTPFSALALAELAERAGLPAGLLQVVTGDSERIGKRLCESERIRKLSFTGSTRIGKLLAAQCADSLKKLSLELGGNAAFIVFDDADLHAAIEGLMVAKFRNGGQTCVCANRVFVQDGVYDKFVKLLVDRVAKLKVGDGFSGSQIGPMINQSGADKVRRHIEDAKSRGGVVQYGSAVPADSLFISPHVISEASDDMLLAQEETFGPVAGVFRFSDEQEVIERANATPYGLANYCYTQSLARAWRLSEQLESGMVGINEGLVSTAVAPFGGVKESGLGREGGRQGLDEFLQDKYVLMGGL